MGYFKSHWQDKLLPIPLTDLHKIDLLEKVRFKWSINDDDFAAIVTSSAAWQRQVVQFIADGFWTIFPKAPAHLITALTLVICNTLEMDKKLVVVTRPLLDQATRQSDQKLAEVARDPLVYLTLEGVLDLDDIVEMTLDGRELYLNAPEEARTLLAEVDSGLGWDYYSKLMPHKLEVMGLSRTTGLNYRVPQTAVRIRMSPYYDEYLARAMRGEDMKQLSDQYGKLLGVPPLQITMAMQGFLENKYPDLKAT